MTQDIGIIKEIFIPFQDNMVDTMNINKLGFKIDFDDCIEELILEINNNNACIMKDDIVLITKQVINGYELIDIEKYEGNEYE